MHIRSAIVFSLVLGLALTASHARERPTSTCEIRKAKCVVLKVKGNLSCERNAAKRGLPVDPNCTLKVAQKFDFVLVGRPKGCMTKRDAAHPTVPCLTLGDAPEVAAKIGALVADLKTALYTNPDPTDANACWAAQAKCAIRLVKDALKCHMKAVDTGAPVNAQCLDEAAESWSNGATGCMDKLDLPGKACTLTGLPGQAASAKAVIDAFLYDLRAGLMPDKVLRIVTAPAGGTCGAVSDGGGTLATLACGHLVLGGGTSAAGPGVVPAGAPTSFAVMGGTAVSGLPASGPECSGTGCLFGAPLPIASGVLSMCVAQTFMAPASGTLDPGAGTFTGDLPLASLATLTSNATQPCPLCVGNTCDGTASNGGAACTPDADSGESHDCIPAGPVLPPLGISFPGVTTGAATASDGSGIFCPGQAHAGAFGHPTAIDVTATGEPAGNLETGQPPRPATLASVFCVPVTGNLLIDGSSDLPGPGAITLPITADLL